MKANIIYVEGHEGSEYQASVSRATALAHGWDVELVPGVTPETLNEEDFDFPNLRNGRFADFARQDRRKYLVKKSCLFNHLKFAQRVIVANEPMIFLEHDTVIIDRLPDFEFDEYCFLSYEYAFQPPGCLDKPPYNRYKLSGEPGVNDFPEDYPLVYYHKSVYNGARQTPGTAAYALNPKGAVRLLHAASGGLEQSDYIINSQTMKLQYLWPSPVRYQSENLNLSHNL